MASASATRLVGFISILYGDGSPGGADPGRIGPWRSAAFAPGARTPSDVALGGERFGEFGFGGGRFTGGLPGAVIERTLQLHAFRGGGAGPLEPCAAVHARGDTESGGGFGQL